MWALYLGPPGDPLNKQMPMRRSVADDAYAALNGPGSGEHGVGARLLPASPSVRLACTRQAGTDQGKQGSVAAIPNLHACVATRHGLPVSAPWRTSHDHAKSLPFKKTLLYRSEALGPYHNMILSHAWDRI